VVGPPPASWAVDAGAVRAFELMPGLWHLRLPVPWHHLTHANAYAIDRADGGIVLVDCGGAGHPSAWEALTRALALAGRTVDDVRELAITHFHSDHMGLAGPLAAASGCAVWGHPAHAHLFDAVDEPEREYARRLAFAREEGVPDEWLDAAASVGEEVEGIEEPVRPERPLAAGAAVESALGAWEVIETPGHAPSHVCLCQRERSLLISGDLVSAVFTTYGDWGYTPDPIGEYRASIEAIGRLDVALALPGHGRPIADLPPLVQLYGAGMERRLWEVEDAVRRGPTDAWAAAQEVFGAQEADASAVWAFYETAGYLRHLERTGRVRREPSARYVAA
jgi:glyoxylase-like metal-dependent hydrolase (beta-lactamase superfamily II)